jgi:hypothetical protein
MAGRPDRLRVAIRGGLAVDKALLIHEGELPHHHDHLRSRQARGERVEPALAQRLGQRVHTARRIAHQPRRQLEDSRWSQNPMAWPDQQDGAAPGFGFSVEDKDAVEGTGHPVDLHGALVFQREAVLFDAAQRGRQVGHHLCAPTTQITRAAAPA